MFTREFIGDAVPGRVGNRLTYRVIERALVSCIVVDVECYGTERRNFRGERVEERIVLPEWSSQ